MNAVAGCWAAKKTHNSNRACQISQDEALFMLFITQHMEDESVAQWLLGLAEASWKSLVEKFCPGTLRRKELYCLRRRLQAHTCWEHDHEAAQILCDFAAGVALHVPAKSGGQWFWGYLSTYSVLRRCCKNLELCMMHWCHMLFARTFKHFLSFFVHFAIVPSQTWSHACHAIPLSLKRRRQKTVPVCHGDSWRSTLEYTWIYKVFSNLLSIDRHILCIFMYFRHSCIYL